MATLKSVDILESSYLLRGVSDPQAGRARRGVAVTGLTGTGPGGDLAEAYSFLGTELESEHPADGSLALSAIDMRSLRPGVVLGSAHYRPLTGLDLRRTAESQTNRHAGTMSLTWWRDTTSFDADGLPNGPVCFEPYASDTDPSIRIPRPWTWTVGVQVIEMPTLLSSHPSTLHLNKVGTVNAANDYQFLAVGGFPAGSLLFDGWTSRYVGGGKFFVVYRAIYMKQKWPRMPEPVFNTTSSLWECTPVPSYPAESWGTFPTHTVLT